MCLSLAVARRGQPANWPPTPASPPGRRDHLAQLIAGRILRVERQGRWRYYRLAGVDVGHAVEALSVVAPPLSNPFTLNGMPDSARRLKNARTCYSHLAGKLGVLLAEALVALRWLEDDGHRYRLTRTGVRSLHAIGVDLVPRRAPVPARRCLDWTERRPHVAGPMGTALAKVALDRGWIRRLRGTRAVAVTPLGRQQLHKLFDVRWEERP